MDSYTNKLKTAWELVDNLGLREEAVELSKSEWFSLFDFLHKRGFVYNTDRSEWIITMTAEDYLKLLVPVEFPYVQKYMEEPWFNEECHLINDDAGLEQFGSSAYYVPLYRINNHYHL